MGSFHDDDIDDDWDDERRHCRQEIQMLNERIASLESQLAARNQAAEAMGVLERLVVGIDHETKSWVTLVQCEDGKYELRLYKMTDFINGSPAPSITNANSLIETVLKAGGTDDSK